MGKILLRSPAEPPLDSHFEENADTSEQNAFFWYEGLGGAVRRELRSPIFDGMKNWASQQGGELDPVSILCEPSGPVEQPRQALRSVGVAL